MEKKEWVERNNVFAVCHRVCAKAVAVNGKISEFLFIPSRDHVKC